MNWDAEPRLPRPRLESLLAELDRLDIKLRVEADRLRFDAPQGAMTSELRARLQASKSELIAFLTNKREPVNTEETSVSETPEGVKTYPLSFAQRHFGLLQRRYPAEYFYNVPFAYRLKGKLDIPLLRESLKAIARRHELMRTTLREVVGNVMQVVAPFDEGLVPTVPLIELPVLPEPERSETAYRAMQAEWRKPFDLEKDCPLRVRLFRLADEEHILLLCMHNVLFEAGSLQALLQEISAHYAAFLAGKPCSLPPLPIQYADYVRWQQALLAAGMDARLAYWRDWFSRGEPPLPTLSIAKRNELPTTFAAGVMTFEFPPALTEGLNRLCRHVGVTLFIPLLSAYALVLQRHSGLSDIVLGTTFVNRNHWKLEPLIGSLLNVVALRIDLNGDPDFCTFLKSMRDRVLTAFSQQEVPFAYIAPLLQPEQPRATPLFRTVLTFFGELPDNRLRLPEIEVTAMDNIYCDWMYPDMYPTLWEQKADSGTVLKGYWQYKLELYEESTVKQLLRDFQSILEIMAADAERPIRSVLF